ncbi:MAG: STAS domain-containing protein [Phycisphaeraceae bacterium]|nr:STAS domain-containing protein [Phycisphaeraceae bacterium]
MADESGVRVSTERRGNATVVKPSGEIDISGSPVLREALRGAAAGGAPVVVVDLAGVSYMDSSGLATLVEAMKNANSRKARLVLCNMAERVRAVFEIAHLDRYFRIASSLEEALGG